MNMDVPSVFGCLLRSATRCGGAQSRRFCMKATELEKVKQERHFVWLARKQAGAGRQRAAGAWESAW